MADVAVKEPIVESEGAAPPPAPEDVAAMFDLSKMKKKKKKVKKEKKDDDEAGEGADAGGEESGAAASSSAVVTGATGVLVQDPATYSYQAELLARIMSKLHENNPELSDRKRATMKPPQVMRGTCALHYALGRYGGQGLMLCLLLQSVRRRRCGSTFPRFAR
jgi:hypothetical protein